MTVNAPARPHPGIMHVDEFMAFLETRPKEERWHLIEGNAVMMAPPSMAHQRIALNLCELLNRAFAARARNLYAYHEIAIRLPGMINFQPEPDVIVAGTPADHNDLYAQEWQLVAEVLSPTNTRAEIDLKLRYYREGPSNLYALIIEPQRFLVEVHARNCNWEPLVLNKANDLIEMPEFGMSCSVRDLYQGTTLVGR